MSATLDAPIDAKVACLLGIGRIADWDCRLSRWHPHSANEKSEQVFSNQALNTLDSYASRSLLGLNTAWGLRLVRNASIRERTTATALDTREVCNTVDFWITDPPYADAVNYHELSEFFLAWYARTLPELVPDWQTDSRRALAVRGTGAAFRMSMVDCYRNLATRMPSDGMQVVMFTHQDSAVWADLTLILWAGGLRVTAAWTIATETESALKQGNYVQGTVLLVLHKQSAQETAFSHEVIPDIEIEVERQLDNMRQLDDRDEPNFSDADLQLAAYAAALRVLTKYRAIEDIDIAAEHARERRTGEGNPIRAIIEDAVRTASNHLVPTGLPGYLWRQLAPEEKLYLKGLEDEGHGDYRAGVYQEFARGFGIHDYRFLLHTAKANETRLKTASEFGRRYLGDSPFGASLVRHALYAVWQATETDDVADSLTWLRTELADYWPRRESLVGVLRYLGAIQIGHWRQDAKGRRSRRRCRRERPCLTSPHHFAPCSRPPATCPAASPRPASTSVRAPRRGPGRSSFHPDARWHSLAHDLTVYFKYAESQAARSDVASWQQEIWNESRSPLLGVVGPERVDLYNGFGRPRRPEDIDRNRLKVCRYDQLGELDDYAGRLAMETGQFWRNESRVNRRNAVDHRLLDHLRGLQDKLIESDLPMLDAQGLIGRCIFAKYLIDRGIVTQQRLQTEYGYGRLERLLRDRDAAQRLFAWLRDTFNGDMFPPGSPFVPNAQHLERVARFLDGEDPRSGQMSLFPYRFDIIPIELISAIYEQFVHSRTPDGAPRSTSKGVHYTPVPVVSFVLDEVMDGLSGKETVLDITCGSGIFLVEALRRLVRIKAGDAPPTRTMIRETLYKQIHGIDISEPAIRVAAFSLVLAALELDPDPRPTRSLRFKTLQGSALFVGNAFDVEATAEGRKLTTNSGLRKFDLILGNPPWESGDRSHVGVPSAPDMGTTSLRYLAKSMAYAHDRTRFGVVLSAKAFFSRHRTWLASAQDLASDLSPLTLVNLANLRPWLFPKADMPGMLLLARYRKQKPGTMELIQTEWSRTGMQGHVIDTVPSDIESLPIKGWRRHPELLKAAFYGRLHDQLLLDDQYNELAPLAERLDAIGVRFAEGLKRGSRQDASHLVGLPLLGRGGLRPFAVKPVRATFQDLHAERPRGADNYKAPLLLVQESVSLVGGGGRVVSAVSREDVVYPDQFDGASFAGVEEDAAYLVAGILGSAFVSWYLIMASSDFGLWRRRALLSDIRSVPVPDIEVAIASPDGAQVVALAKRFEGAAPANEDWTELDEAVFDLYGLDETQRLVVRDGLFRTTWQWDEGRNSSIEAATPDQMRSYVQAFAGNLDFWFYAANQRRLRGEVISLPESAPVRIVRFVLEDKPPPSTTGVVEEGSLNEVLARMSDRYGLPVGEELVARGELKIGNAHEVVLIKPSARRHWLTVNALSDARRVLESSFPGGPR